MAHSSVSFFPTTRLQYSELPGKPEESGNVTKLRFSEN